MNKKAGRKQAQGDAVRWILRAAIVALILGLGAGCAVDGKAVFDKDCLACHRIRGVGGAICPDLTDVSSRREKAWIEQQIRDSSVNNPESKMPGFPHLSDKEVQALVNYLAK